MTVLYHNILIIANMKIKYEIIENNLSYAIIGIIEFIPNNIK